MWGETWKNADASPGTPAPVELTVKTLLSHPILENATVPPLLDGLQTFMSSPTHHPRSVDAASLPRQKSGSATSARHTQGQSLRNVPRM
eukprot:5491441-Pyramimonas_sp.AAC.1